MEIDMAHIRRCKVQIFKGRRTCIESLRIRDNLKDNVIPTGLNCKTDKFW